MNATDGCGAPVLCPSERAKNCGAPEKILCRSGISIGEMIRSSLTGAFGGGSSCVLAGGGGGNGLFIGETGGSSDFEGEGGC